jgi:1-acyl-sn-glycerol-3-phosphate acyltransferase
VAIPRAAFNTVFLGLWTAFMVSYAITASVVLRDFGFFRRAQRDWAAGLLRVWGVDIQVFGAEHMDPTRSYVVMANHQSYADIVALFMVLPIIPGFLAKSELKAVPFLGAALRAGGHVVIDRKKHDSAMQTIDSAAEQVRGGKTVLIFPEGTRSATETIAPFKSGGFRLARSAEVPIVPVGLRGSGRVGPKNSLLFRPGHIEVHIGAPISVEALASTDHAELMQQVRAKVSELSAMPLQAPPDRA